MAARFPFALAIAGILTLGVAADVPAAQGTVINVFGPRGWGIPYDSATWQPPRAHPGDLLNFTYVPDGTGHHNVWRLASKKAYGACNFTGGTLLGNTTHVMLRLNRPGRYFFACSTISVSSHCQNGQKFSIRVYPANQASAQQHPVSMFAAVQAAATGNLPTTTPAKRKNTKVVQVWGSVGWRIPPPGFRWPLPAIHAGDRLHFTSSPQGPAQSVYKMRDAAAWRACDYAGSVLVGSGPDVVGRLPKSGRFFYAGQEQDCKRGQKVIIDVLPRIRNAGEPPAVEVVYPVGPQPVPTPLTGPGPQLPVKPVYRPVAKLPKQPAKLPKQPAKLPKQPAKLPKQPAKLPKQPAKLPKQPAKLPKQPAKLPKTPAKSVHAPTHIAKSVNVFGDIGWKIPPIGFQWHAPAVYVGDTLNFSYVPFGPTLFHNVWEMPDAAAYGDCDFSRATLKGNSTRVLLRLTRPGMAYYACSAMGFHCTMGQKVAFSVLP